MTSEPCSGCGGVKPLLDEAFAHDVLVVALATTRQYALRRAAAGVDLIVAQVALRPAAVRVKSRRWRWSRWWTSTVRARLGARSGRSWTADISATLGDSGLRYLP